MNKLLELIEVNNYSSENEYKQSLIELFSSLDDEYFINKYQITKEEMMELITPTNVIGFDVNWIDDNGLLHVNKGYRVQHNNFNGPYKGGLRFHPSVNVSILKALALEQTFKNILTGLPMGGAKGGSDFDPKGKSDNEIKNFCYAFMKELYPYIGSKVDIPAGDIGVGSKEIQYLFEAYKQYSKKDDCALTGKPIFMGGSLCRKEATGFGLVYFANEALRAYKNESFKGKRVIISGSGNVAIYAAKKVIELGGIVVAMSDSNNAIYVDSGVNFDEIVDLKENRKARIKEYKHGSDKVEILSSPKEIWNVKCDIALPCATQFELDIEGAKSLVKNHVIGVFEGSNISTTIEAQKYLVENGVIYSPGKASNAGGVSVSYLEIKQNELKEVWPFEKVDRELEKIMSCIFSNCYQISKNYKYQNDLSFGANTYSFEKLIVLMREKNK